MNEIFKNEEEGYIKYNNIELVEANDNEVILKTELTKNSLNPYGIAHGGLIFTLGDTAMGIASKMTGRESVTLSSNITYLKPGKGEFIIAKGKIIKDGKTTCYLKADIYNDKDDLIATMDANYFYIN